MQRSMMAVLVSIMCASCGDHGASLPEGVVGTYVSGDAEKARQKIRPAKRKDPNAPKTTRDLIDRMNAGESFTLSASVDMLLELRPDGTFEYYGPLKMGDDQARIHGHWSSDTKTLRLRLESPRRSKDSMISEVICRISPGVVQYPLGRDPRVAVYYSLVDTSRKIEGAPPKGGIRIGTK